MKRKKRSLKRTLEKKVLIHKSNPRAPDTSALVQNYEAKAEMTAHDGGKTYGQAHTPKRYREFKYYDWIRLVDDAYNAGHEEAMKWAKGVLASERSNAAQLRKDLAEAQLQLIRFRMLSDLLIEKHGYLHGRD